MNKIDIVLKIKESLATHRTKLSESFFQLNPYTKTKFFVLDDVLPEEIVIQAYNNFPKDSQYLYRKTFREKKLTFAKLNELEHPFTEELTDAFGAQEIIDEIAKITGMPDLEGDPSLYAGGLSRMDKTHFLNPHIDNSHDGNRARYRRLNLLFYVTPNIDENDGGSFELWDEQVLSPLKLASKFNRLIVMETNRTSWHSVDPVLSNIKRCCVSNYYFSKLSPSGENYYHVTSFTGRPNQSIQRLYGRVDNFLRQSVSSVLKISRGKQLARRNNQN